MAFSLRTIEGTGSVFRSIDLSSNLLAKSMEKLASGLRINRAADDPAGLIISEQIRSRIATLNQEITNISGQINKYETASSSAMSMRGYLTEMRSMAVAASNGAVNDSTIQQAYQAEADRLVETYNNVAETASFGTQNLFDGSSGSLTTIPSMAKVDFSTLESSEEAINTIDSEIARLDSTIADMGATQKNDLESRQRNLQVEAENLTAAESNIRDTDYARELSNFLRNELLLKSAFALLAHSSMTAQTVLKLLGRK
jgi:flagellin